MQRQTFKTEDLKSALERSLGFGIRSLVRLGGGGAMNYKAERASDGLPFVVKCFPRERHRTYEFLADTLKALEGVKTPERLFADRQPLAFAEYKLLCLSWREGEVVFPDLLSDEQWKAFLDDFMMFASRMQTVSTNDMALPVRDLWTSVWKACDGIRGRIIHPVLEHMGADDLDYRPELIRTVHGDFHRGNLLFCKGKLSCIMDLESFRKGYPAEDICALLMITARNLKKSEHVRLERLLSLFRQAVDRLPYSSHEWLMSINALYMRTLCRKTDNLRNLGLFKVLELRGRDRISEMFRQQVG